MRTRLIVLVTLFLLSVIGASVVSADIILPVPPLITVCTPDGVCVTIPG